MIAINRNTALLRWRSQRSRLGLMVVIRVRRVLLSVSMAASAKSHAARLSETVGRRYR